MLTADSRIGPVIIERLLGRGAMGEVYAARQVSVGRAVAVKRIAAHLLDDAQAVDRFQREAVCLARIQSEHVVTMYDAGRFADQHGVEHWLMIMELIDGGMNARGLCGAAVAWDQATTVIQHALLGLAAAAEHGVIHRDIKPDNIMITRRGVAKLVDFGLARAADSTALTSAGSLMGTPAYMPPEACRGEEVDARGDLYALGCTWFHLLTGRVPFPASNTMAALRGHLEDPVPDPRRLVPQIPAEIAALAMRLMAKDPAQRPTSAAHCAAELRALGMPIPATLSARMVEQTLIASAPTTKATAAMAITVSDAAPASQAETATTVAPATHARTSGNAWPWIIAIAATVAIAVGSWFAMSSVHRALSDWLQPRPDYAAELRSVRDRAGREAALERASALLDMSPSATMAALIVQELGDGREPPIIRAVLIAANAAAPVDGPLQEALLREMREQEPWNALAVRIRAGALRQHPHAATMARQWLADLSAERDQRANAFLALDEAHVLSDGERIRYHMWCLSELPVTDGQVRSAALWLLANAEQPGWNERVRAAQVPAFTQIRSLDARGDLAQIVSKAIATAAWPQARAVILREKEKDDGSSAARMAATIYVVAPFDR